MSPAFKDKSINPYTIYILYVPMYGVRCVMQRGGGGGGGEGGVIVGRFQSQSPLAEGKQYTINIFSRYQHLHAI